MPDDENPGTGNDQDGAGDKPQPKPDVPPARSFTQEHVNSIAAKEHKRGAKEALSAFLAERQIASIEELDARLASFKPEETKSKAAEKAKAEEERQKLVQENETLKKRLDGEIVKNAIFPVLATLNVRKPQLALTDIRETTGHDVALKEGKVVIVDSDGDVVSEDAPKWLAEQLKQDVFAMHVKPAVVPRGGSSPDKQKQNGEKPKSPLPETFTDRMRAALAAQSSETED